MRILKLHEVMAMTGLSRSSIYAFIKKNNFPKQIRIGERAIGFLAEEIISWINQKAESREVSK